MSNIPSSRAQKLAAFLFLSFLALFFGRLVASYWFDEANKQGAALFSPARETARHLALEFLSSGYSKDYSNNAASIGLPAAESAAFDVLGNLEVYTREARVGAETIAFDSDVERALGIIAKHRGDIRLESSSGVKPRRSFKVVVRVPVEEFDRCVGQLAEVGDLQTSSVTKEDVSEKARARFAERDALREHAESLARLRSSEGDVGDLLQLEAKIREVEREVRKLDVELGEFVKDESFHNINYALAERIPLFVDENRYPVSARIAGALAWTLRWYSLGLVVGGLAWGTLASTRVLLRR